MLNMTSLFYTKVTGISPVKNKRESFVLVFGSASKFSATSNAIAYLYQLGFSNIDVEECHRATIQEVATYFHCCNTPAIN